MDVLRVIFLVFFRKAILQIMPEQLYWLIYCLVGPPLFVLGEGRGNEFLKNSYCGGNDYFYSQRLVKAAFWGKHLTGGTVILPQHFCF